VKTIRVDIRVQSERELKVVWNDDSPWPAYTIHRQAIEECAREIRRVLREMVDAALKKQVMSYGGVLKNLGEHGHLLYQALFTKVGGEGRPDRIRNYYERLSEPFRLRFVVSDSVFVPWGLVYPLDPSLLPDRSPDDPTKVDWAPYRAFWCLSRELSTLYDRIPPDAAGVAHDSSAHNLVRIVHPETFERAANPLSDCPEHHFLGWLSGRYGAPLTTSRALQEFWRKNSAQIGLLYFYCHASASKLALGNDEKIEASRLFLMLAGAHRPPGSSGCLVLINGCSTAVGSPTGDFLISTSHEGLCGFVGTETEVPDIFALRFSLGLLHLLLHDGFSLGEAMHRMYCNHFPLSLVYGLYAHPNFCMPQNQIPDIEVPENFSFGQVGTNRLEIFNGA
jgi:hypothetical protein